MTIKHGKNHFVAENDDMKQTVWWKPGVNGEVIVTEDKNTGAVSIEDNTKGMPPMDDDLRDRELKGR